MSKVNREKVLNFGSIYKIITMIQILYNKMFKIKFLNNQYFKDKILKKYNIYEKNHFPIKIKIINLLITILIII